MNLESLYPLLGNESKDILNSADKAYRQKLLIESQYESLNIIDGSAEEAVRKFGRKKASRKVKTIKY